MENPETLIPLVVIATVAIAVIAMAASSAALDKRIKELTAWADEHGWRFEERRPDLVGYFSGTPFDKGSNPTAGLALTGTHRGHRVLAYEHTYTTVQSTGQTTTRKTHRFHITALATPVSTPTLQIKEEHFGHTLLNLVGLHDLRLGDDDFDRAFRIETTDDDFTRAVLDADLRAWLLATPAAGHLPLRFTGDHLITWEATRLHPDRVRTVADRLADLLERIPDTAWEQAKAR
ncbi:hypothetical protein [Nocardiopsis coralliicola]